MQNLTKNYKPVVMNPGDKPRESLSQNRSIPKILESKILLTHPLPSHPLQKVIDQAPIQTEDFPTNFSIEKS